MEISFRRYLNPIPEFQNERRMHLLPETLNGSLVFVELTRNQLILLRSMAVVYLIFQVKSLE